MIDISKIDYSAFDHPLITENLFYPREEWAFFPAGSNSESFLITVDEGIEVGAILHPIDKFAANILFFHGNGEIAADYNEVAQLYNETGINFLPVDYRGYGRSTGRPTVTSMMRDAHVIFDYVKKTLKEREYRGPLIVMGRSLGSASALELASNYGDQIHGLIVESGFAYAAPLLNLLGINIKALGIKEEQGFRNIDKIAKYKGPALIIHAEFDNIISFEEGQLLFDACLSNDKKIVIIDGAGHNDIFFSGMSMYMEGIRWLADRAEAAILKNK